jgi:hypothetical protein
MGNGGSHVRVGVPRVAVPVRVTICGLLVALSEIDNSALGLPTTCGPKVTLIEQLVPEASVAPQLVVCAN